MSLSIAYQIIQDLWKLNRNFCSSDYDTSLAYLQKILPFEILAFTSRDQFNGWVIPPKWDLEKGAISYKGDVIFEVQSPLQIIGLSRPFKGRVARNELIQHLHYDSRDDSATPYHFRQNYRPWERDWGFCVAKKFIDSLPEGEFEVEILTKEEEGVLKVATYTKPGKLTETFTFVAHLDHPGMANDDLAAVAVAVELFNRLAKIPTKFTYQIILVQEIIGSLFYLGKSPHLSENILESCFLEMLGSATPLALQSSFKGDTQLEKTIKETMKEKKIPHRVGPFRSIICNDEPIWESYGIPMASLSRFPYPEYHSDKDNLAIMSVEALEESIQLLEGSIKKLEQSTLMRKKFEGVIALSHPQYNLYVDPGQPAFGSVGNEKIQRLRLLMDLLPLYPTYRFVEQIAEDANLPVSEVHAYLRLWEDKKLLELL